LIRAYEKKLGKKKLTPKLTINVPKKPLSSSFLLFVKNQNSRDLKEVAEQYANLKSEDKLELKEKLKEQNAEQIEAYKAYQASVKEEREKIKASLMELSKKEPEVKKKLKQGMKEKISKLQARKAALKDRLKQQKKDFLAKNPSLVQKTKFKERQEKVLNNFMEKYETKMAELKQ
jgi:hypothetical protein